MVEYEEIKKLILVRLEAMPSNIEIFLGGRSLNKEELIEEVKKDTELGKLIVEMQLKYLRQMKEGF
ncbi:MAG: hypothetical protein QMD14_01280 [Candidatus Aenigmarchaeota archaeon]|nr:hypothetical protein [Candidatus Aenigmarchaeota archaeon]